MAHRPPGTPISRTAGLGPGLSLPKNTGSEAGVTALHGVASSASTGDRRALLVALHDKLWAAFNDERTQPRDLSPLTLRLKEIQAEIEAIDLRDQSPNPAVVEDEDFDPRTV